jgi:hypothetical protein
MDLPYAERITFAPVVDGKFLNDTPSNIINNRDSPAFELYKSLDIIIGILFGVVVVSDSMGI